MHCPRRNGYKMHENYLNAGDAIGQFRFITWR